MVSRRGLFGLIFFILPQAQASDCPDLTNSQGSPVSLQQLSLRGEAGTSSTCSVRFGSADPNHYPVREWIFDSNGRISSAVTVGRGPVSKTLGEHSYYVMPVSSHFQALDSKSVQSPYRVKMGELSWSVERSTGNVTFPDQCDGKLTPAGGPGSDKGGFLIKSCLGKIIVDNGWALGQSPEHNRAGIATLRDSQGDSCRVSNTKIYHYYGSVRVCGAGGRNCHQQAVDDFSLKYSSLREWVDFLNSTPGCSKLSTQLQSDQKTVRTLPSPDPVSSGAP